LNDTFFVSAPQLKRDPLGSTVRLLRVDRVLVLTAWLALSCTEADVDIKAPKRALRTDLLGCYALFVGGRPLDSTYYGSSPRVRLDSVPLQSRGRVLRRLDLASRLQDSSQTPFTSWAVDSLAGYIQFSFHNGFSGAVLTLEERESIDSLKGRIANYWDFGPGVSDRRKVRAVRVPCA
jgi:hypothetical protein